MIRRAFADLANRQVHFRYGGSGGIPLVMLHASPGSSKQLEPLIAEMAQTRRVIAPDTAGNGDSTPLTVTAPDIIHYAEATLEFLDNQGLDQVDLYGSHTGASIATELAILAPCRIRTVILDGVGLFSKEERDEYLAHYAPPMTPDMTGSYLNRAFMFCRDQYQFWPWYKHAKENSRGAGLPEPAELHVWVLEVLKAIETYHLGYRAAFSYPKAERLPLVTRPMLAIVGENDPLRVNTALIADLIPGAAFVVTSKPGAAGGGLSTAEAISRFLNATVSDIGS